MEPRKTPTPVSPWQTARHDSIAALRGGKPKPDGGLEGPVVSESSENDDAGGWGEQGPPESDDEPTPEEEDEDKSDPLDDEVSSYLNFFVYRLAHSRCAL